MARGDAGFERRVSGSSGRSQRSVMAGDISYSMEGGLGGGGGEAPIDLEKKSQRAVLTEQWQAAEPLASFDELWHYVLDKMSPQMFRRRRCSAMGGSHVG
jgi:hypothetical protein